MVYALTLSPTGLKARSAEILCGPPLSRSIGPRGRLPIADVEDRIYAVLIIPGARDARANFSNILADVSSGSREGG